MYKVTLIQLDMKVETGDPCMTSILCMEQFVNSMLIW